MYPSWVPEVIEAGSVEHANWVRSNCRWNEFEGPVVGHVQSSEEVEWEKGNTCTRKYWKKMPEKTPELAPEKIPEAEDQSRSKEGDREDGEIPQDSA